MNHAPDGFETRSSAEGRYAAARAFAYLGAVDKVRAACIMECGFAPSDAYIREVLEKRDRMLRPSQSDRGKVVSAHEGYWPDQMREDSEKRSNSLRRALERARSADSACKIHESDRLINQAWDRTVDEARVVHVG